MPKIVYINKPWVKLGVLIGNDTATCGSVPCTTTTFTENKGNVCLGRLGESRKIDLQSKFLSSGITSVYVQ